MENCTGTIIRFLSGKKQKNDVPKVVLTETAPEERELYYEDCFGLDEQKVMMLEKADADGELSLQLMQEGAVIKIRSLAGVCSDGKTERIAFFAQRRA